jgi:phosphate transport system protein
MSHFEERLENDLNDIRDWVWNLGQQVADALLSAKKTLLTRDRELAYSTVLGDNPINRDSRECDRLCHAFIARFLPGAGHLREMASTIRVNVALERVGDYAVTISREALQLSGPLPDNIAAQLDAIADESIDILNKSRIAFRDGNAELATALMQMARRVETRMDLVYETLFGEDDNELTRRDRLAIFVVFNLFKRVADQAKNMCDQTVYTVRGIAKIPKTYRILFLDRQSGCRALLAVAVGRKRFPESGYFAAATAGGQSAPSEDLAGFLAETGLPDEDLVAEQLDVLEHDLGDFHVIVSLHGDVMDHIEQVPFHTSALNWDLSGGTTSSGEELSFKAGYVSLVSQIEQLLKLLAGDGAS